MDSTPQLDRPLVLDRRRPRSFLEWRTLRRWNKLPEWEQDVPGYLLRVAREEAGLSQAALAQRLEVSQQAISRAERWQSNPTIDLMRRWLDACGVTLRLQLRSSLPSDSTKWP